MRRVVPAAALALAAVLVPRAEAAPSVPPPTVTVTQSTVAGAPPVKSPPSVRWNVVKPGKLAELYVQGTNLPGVTTTIETLWTSNPVSIYRGIPAVDWGTEITRKGVPTGSSSASGGIRFRKAGGTWSAWKDTSAPMPALIERFVLGDQIKPYETLKVKYQFQVRFRIVIGDTNNEAHRWVARANN